MSKEVKTQVAVMGSGPAGYAAAFRCGDLGLDTVLIERHDTSTTIERLIDTHAPWYFLRS